MSAALADVLHTDPQFLLAQAREQARQAGLAFAGALPPRQAWLLVQQQAATLVDVRTAEERKFVGQIPGSVAVAWATGTAFTRNPRFIRELEARFAKDQVLLLICRSGQRSAAAALAATAAGFSQMFQVLEGFEGELNGQQQRGHQAGWRFHGLPWVQD